MSHTRSQTSAEFIFILAIFFVLFLFIFSLYINSYQQVRFYREHFEAKEIVTTIAYTVHLVSLDGVSRQISVPGRVGNLDYSLEYFENQRFLAIFWDGGFYSIPLSHEISVANFDSTQYTLSLNNSVVVIS